MKSTMKRILAMMLCLAMMATLVLTGCSSKNAPASDSESQDTTTSTTDETNTADESDASAETDNTADTASGNHDLLATDLTKETIKVGILCNFSSIAAAYFVPGTLYAIQQVNQAGGINGKTIEIVTRDSQGDASNVAQKLSELKDAGCVAIVGPDSDSQAPTAATWAEENKVAVISPSTQSTAVALNAHSKYLFVSGLNSWAIINAINDDIKDKGYEKFAVVGTDGGSSADFINLSKREFDAEQATAVQVSASSTDLNSVVMAIQGTNPDFTISSISATTWTSFFAQAVALGLYENIMNYGWEMQEGLYVGTLGDDYPAGHLRGATLYPFAVDELTAEQQAFNDGILAVGKEYFNQDGLVISAQEMSWYIAAQSVIEACKLLEDEGKEYNGDNFVEALESISFTTPYHESPISWRAMDHALCVPYYFGTIVWKDEAAHTITYTDTKWYDANDILPTHDDYKAFADEQGIAMDW